MKKKITILLGLVFLIGLILGNVIAELGNLGDDLDKKDRTIDSTLDSNTKNVLNNAGYANPYFEDIYSRVNDDGTTDIIGKFVLIINNEEYVEDDVVILYNLDFNRGYHSGMTDDEIIDIETQIYIDEYLKVIAEELVMVAPIKEDLGLGRRTIGL